MILQRLSQSLKTQNWTAIGIEFVLLVVGVYLGIQVSNWNADRVESIRERVLLIELRSEMVESIKQLRIKQKAYEQVGKAGERSVAFLDAGAQCTDNCWSAVVDFFQASQWQNISVGRSTYDEMRRNGWPRNRLIIDAVEDYLRQANQISKPLENPPEYRALVRGLIPLAIHKLYWVNCFELVNGEEAYVENCPQGVAPEISAAGIAAIKNHPEIHRALTEWAGYSSAEGSSISSLITSADIAIALIDKEIETKP